MSKDAETIFQTIDMDDIVGGTDLDKLSRCPLAPSSRNHSVQNECTDNGCPFYHVTSDCVEFVRTGLCSALQTDDSCALRHRDAAHKRFAECLPVRKSIDQRIKTQWDIVQSLTSSDDVDLSMLCQGDHAGEIQAAWHRLCEHDGGLDYNGVLREMLAILRMRKNSGSADKQISTSSSTLVLLERLFRKHQLYSWLLCERFDDAKRQAAAESATAVGDDTQTVASRLVCRNFEGNDCPWAICLSVRPAHEALAELHLHAGSYIENFGRLLNSGFIAM